MSILVIMILVILSVSQEVDSTATTFNYPFSNQPSKFLSIIHREFLTFFNRCWEMCPESSIPLSESVVCATRHLTCPIFASLEVMPRVSTAVHLLVAYDDITRQLANDNDNYKFLHVHIVYCRSYS